MTTAQLKTADTAITNVKSVADALTEVLKDTYRLVLPIPIIGT